MYKYSDNQRKLSKHKNDLGIIELSDNFYEKTLKELLDKNQFKYHDRKGFLKDAEDYCLVDFYFPYPFKAVIQVPETKTKVDGKCLEERFIHSWCLKPEDFNDLVKLEDSLKVYLSNCKYRTKTRGGLIVRR